MQNFIKNNLNFLNQDWLIIADGEALSKNKLEKLSFNRKILVLDGAYKIIKKFNLNFDFLLGDLDSVDLKDLEDLKIKNPEKIIHTPDQNKTDLDKGLEFIFNFQPKNISIASAVGLRLQHSLYNLRALKRYFKPLENFQEFKKLDQSDFKACPLSIFSEKEQINYYENTEVMIAGSPGQSIGILGFPKGMASSEGLKYELENYVLDFEKSNSTSNSFERDCVKLKITGEVLVILEFKEN